MSGASDRHPDIHWPSGVRPTMRTASARQAVVQPPHALAFALLTDVPRWPEWVPGLSAVRTGPIELSFEVWLDDQRFEMFAGEHVPYTRLGWSAVDAGGGSTRRGCSLR
ncbi:hypothetical protein SGRIM119S_07687 [Streptomyces griseorubiginosus]